MEQSKEVQEPFLNVYLSEVSVQAQGMAIAFNYRL